MQAENVAVRGENLNTYFTYSLYTNVCRSLFERHKLLFSFLLTIKIQQQEGLIDAKEWRFLLAGPMAGKLPDSICELRSVESAAGMSIPLVLLTVICTQCSAMSGFLNAKLMRNYFSGSMLTGCLESLSCQS